MGVVKDDDGPALADRRWVRKYVVLFFVGHDVGLAVALLIALRTGIL